MKRTIVAASLAMFVGCGGAPGVGGSAGTNGTAGTSATTGTGGGVTSLGLTMFVGTFGAVFAALGGLLITGYVRAGRQAA